MKKRIIVIFIITGIFLILFLFFLNPSGFRTGGISSISVDDTASVQRIEIIGSDTIVLERSDLQSWRLNRKYRANQVPVNNFLYAFTEMRVAGISYDLKTNDSLQVKIRIFAGRKKYFFRYYPAGGRNLIHREGGKKIFSIEIPGASGKEISNVFSDNLNYWRDRMIMDFLPDEISMIQVTHLSDPSCDFIMRIENSVPVLYERDGKTKVAPENLDTERIRMYLTYFINIFFDETTVGNNYSYLRFTEEPEYILTVKPWKGDPVKISVYPIINGNSRDLFKAGMRMNDDPEMLIVRYIAIDLVLKSKLDFFKIQELSGLRR